MISAENDAARVRRFVSHTVFRHPKHGKALARLVLITEERKGRYVRGPVVQSRAGLAGCAQRGESVCLPRQVEHGRAGKTGQTVSRGRQLCTFCV
jgi:hypothetical protein